MAKFGRVSVLKRAESPVMSSAHEILTFKCPVSTARLSYASSLLSGWLNMWPLQCSETVKVVHKIKPLTSNNTSSTPEGIREKVEF